MRAFHGPARSQTRVVPQPGHARTLATPPSDSARPSSVADELAKLKAENEALRQRLRSIREQQPDVSQASTNASKPPEAAARPAERRYNSGASAAPRPAPPSTPSSPAAHAPPAAPPPNQAELDRATQVPPRPPAQTPPRPPSALPTVPLHRQSKSAEPDSRPAAQAYSASTYTRITATPFPGGPARSSHDHAASNGSAPSTSNSSGNSSNGASPTPAPPLRVPKTLLDVWDDMESQELENPSEELKALRERVASGAATSASRTVPTSSRTRNQRSLSFLSRSALNTSLMSMVFVAAEVAPYSKSGGLGDVMGALPIALAKRGHRVMVVSPRYQTCERDKKLAKGLHDCSTWVKLLLGNGEHWANFHHEARDGVDWVYVEHLCFQRDGSLYGDSNGIYQDNMFRYALLSMAACEAALQLTLPSSAKRFQTWLSRNDARAKSLTAEAMTYSAALPDAPCSTYGEDVVFVANDWHAGMVPVYLKHKYQAHGVFTDARAVYAVHNLAYQGTALAHESSLLAVPEAYSELEWIYQETDGRRTPVVNIMKAALLNAHRVVTVSESYAAEIMSPAHGVGLHTVLQSVAPRLNGIVNGMDMESWDPTSDPHLEQNYSADDLTGKAACKRALLRELGLPEPEFNVEVPLVGFVGRLDPQKGPDLIVKALPALLALDCQVVMLGSGHPSLEHELAEAEQRHPDFFRSIVSFDESLAHRIMAASDILLMPSRFEPCGLNQMHAMRYGTVPVAAATGGLKDTVTEVSPFAEDVEEELGTGWLFAPPTPIQLASAMRSAVKVYVSDRERWRVIQRNGMDEDFSWSRAARAYEVVARSAIDMDSAVPC